MNQKSDRNILAATFPTPDGGARAAAALAGAVPEKVANIAVLVVDGAGKASFVETKDWGAGRGALVGGAVGLIAGPVGMLTVGTIGALAAKLRDTGFPDKELARLGRTLQPGSSALVVDLAADAVDVASGLLEPLSPSDRVVADIDADVASLFDQQPQTLASAQPGTV